jgi:hypothetical protein
MTREETLHVLVKPKGEEKTELSCMSRGEKIPTSLVVTISALRLRFPYPPRVFARSNLGETLLAGFRTATSPALRFAVLSAPI